ncbi:transposase [Salirhabdus sp. Marseille-P4669]|uniref:transposase n=1 Tax=Salirhabdus sp. Marseille-P4669 TaxID=2042310 RepID=UPI000C7B13A9|nr:transposase [Salirhabdus sp. Marseille-P4669]
MPRKLRVWIPHYFYHIVCRGNRRDDLFRDAGDFKTFKLILAQVHHKFPFEIAAYCLMTNHFHLMLRSSEYPISKVMSLINKRYADYYNTKNNFTGHVFEKRYFAEVLNTYRSMLEVSKYIHLNPVKAGMVVKPEAYKWSSYSYYVTENVPNLYPYMNITPVLDCLNVPEELKMEQYYQYMLQDPESEEESTSFRDSTKFGE